MFKKEDEPRVSIVSNNQSGGITAHTVNFAKPQRKLDEALRAEFRAGIPRDKPLMIYTVFGDQEAINLAKEVYEFLKSENFRFHGDTMYRAGVYADPPKGLSVDTGSEVTIVGIGVA